MGFFTDSMTVYNYRKDADGEHWLRSVVHGVQWRHGKRKVNFSEGVFSEEPEESITVDFQGNYGNKPFLSPAEYRKKPLEEAGNYWTLDQTDGMHVVVCGAVDQEITDSYGISRLRKEYPDVYNILSVADNRNRPRLKHIKVVAK